MIPNIDILAEELTEVEYANNTYRIVNVNVYDKVTPELIVIDSGYCGENVKWKLYDNGLFYISGKGEMYDYSNYDPPFAIHRDEITNVIIEYGVTSIGDDALYECANLTSVTIPDSVTTIGSGAFSGCLSLTSITIPNGVTIIDGGAFWRCENLSKIIIPNSVRYIGKTIIYLCSNLHNIYYTGTETQWNEIVIDTPNSSLFDSTVTLHYNHLIADTLPVSGCGVYNGVSQHPNSTCSDYYDRIDGYVDDVDAIKQAIYLILSTERYKHIIYSWDYGMELLDLYGKPLPYVMADLPRRIKEALTQDNRIEDVTDFEFERNGKRLHTTFTVVTNAGNLTTDLEVEV